MSSPSSFIFSLLIALTVRWGPTIRGLRVTSNRERQKEKKRKRKIKALSLSFGYAEEESDQLGNKTRKEIKKKKKN